MCGEKSFCNLSRSFRLRITPACAGKRKMTGEDAICVIGSPPHVRGKGKSSIGFISFLRITPACAGKSYQVSACQRQREDHPRMCGEKELELIPKRQLKGSPPHVRGKVALFVLALLAPGITPACAGKRLKRSSLNRHF